MGKELKQRYGAWGLVAGAAEGLGRAFSRNLAAGGLNLILVDQQEELLASLARELESGYGIRVKTLHLDLASEDASEGIMKEIREADCRLIVYNAAFSRVQRFLQNDPGMLDRYVQVNMRTPLQLVHAFCTHHSSIKDPRKGIILMSSLAGSWGTQLLGPYGGTKAFNQILAESLHFELKGEGFDITACIAGATATPGYLASLPFGQNRPRSAMNPDRVAGAALEALGKRPFVVTGFPNKLVYFLMTRILPRRVSLRIMNRAVGNRYRDKL